MAEDYDPDQNGVLGYDLALRAIREMRIRRGEIEPTTERERAWAAEGVRDWCELEAVANG